MNIYDIQELGQAMNSPPEQIVTCPYAEAAAESKCWVEGFDAGVNLEVTGCPYQLPTERWRIWWEGYMAGEQKYLDWSKGCESSLS